MQFTSLVASYDTHWMDSGDSKYFWSVTIRNKMLCDGRKSEFTCSFNLFGLATESIMWNAKLSKRT